MSTAKFEKLIDLIINEDQERAEQLFHEIVVEKSREIYESLLSEDMTTDFIDEISAEEEGMEGMMEDDEFIDDEEIDGDYDVEEDEEDFDSDDMDIEVTDDADEEHGEEMDGLEDRVVDLEDKLDELMAEFESIMDSEDESEEIDVEMDDSDEEMNDSDEEMDLNEVRKGRQEREGQKDLRKSKEDRRYAADDFDKVDESAEMKRVSTPTNASVSSKSPVDSNSGQRGMASRPVNFDGGVDTQQPKGPARPKNYATKGETEVKGSTSWKNKIGGDSATGRGNGESAPKPTTKQPAGGDQRSPVPESTRTKRKIIK
jgi:hypothetical protein